MLQLKQEELEKKSTLIIAHDQEKTQLHSAFESEKESLYAGMQKQIDEAKELTSKQRKQIEDAAIKAFKISDDFLKEFGEQLLDAYNDGMNHILRMAVQAGPYSLDQFITQKETKLYDMKAREGHAIIPYKLKDLEAICHKDRKDKLPCWVPQSLYMKI